MFNFIKKNLNNNTQETSQKIFPASSGEAMHEFAQYIKDFTTIKPLNIFEIGANLAQDAEFLRKEFNLKPKKIWVFEPHPQCFEIIKKKYKFNSYDFAVSNKNGEAKFNAINLLVNSNSGISSLLNDTLRNKDNYLKINVKTSRMDTFIEMNKIKNIDFLKLDAEGFNFEILKGFGQYLKKVKCIHTEAEHKKI